MTSYGAKKTTWEGAAGKLGKEISAPHQMSLVSIRFSSSRGCKLRITFLDVWQRDVAKISRERRLV